VKFTFIISKS